MIGKIIGALVGREVERRNGDSGLKGAAIGALTMGAMRRMGPLGMILGAAYMLYLYRRVVFGRITRDDLRGLLDLSPREYAVFAPLIVLTIWMGIYPQSFLSFFEASVAALVERHHAALGAARLAGL
jgi:NADH-quinone oxidoreductase subunit M